MDEAFAMQCWLKSATCCVCAVAFAFDSALYDKRRADRGEFYCPNGHSLRFTGDPEAVVLRRELAVERTRREEAERESKRLLHSKRVYRGKLKALKSRVKNGVCPCCHRSFEQLARHIATKHPGYSAESVE